MASQASQAAAQHPRGARLAAGRLGALHQFRDDLDAGIDGAILGRNALGFRVNPAYIIFYYIMLYYIILYILNYILNYIIFYYIVL